MTPERASCVRSAHAQRRLALRELRAIVDACASSKGQLEAHDATLARRLLDDVGQVQLALRVVGGQALTAPRAGTAREPRTRRG